MKPTAVNGAASLTPPPGPPLFKRLVIALLGSWTDRAITLICVALLIWLLPGFIDWAFLDAIWSVAEADACKPDRGACWAVVEARHRLIFFGLYPFDEHWRSAIACLVIVLITAMSCVPASWTPKRIATLWVTGFIAFYILMHGGIFGLKEVTTDRWGGLALTLYIFAAVVLLGFPMAIFLALARRSELPLIRRMAAFFID
ncbi:MAG: amino acid ABC transporter permease, partial [Chromatiales bacterium]|nr:amino acid ABC transporter permease [Chromatiales bacterium]